jgi:alkaline phosphatase D
MSFGVTADVHYPAAFRYAPDRAKFTNFDPFWEFVAGPINAGTFGPGQMDLTFGPETKFVGIPADMKQNAHLLTDCSSTASGVSTEIPKS